MWGAPNESVTCRGHSRHRGTRWGESGPPCYESFTGQGKIKVGAYLSHHPLAVPRNEVAGEWWCWEVVLILDRSSSQVKGLLDEGKSGPRLVSGPSTTRACERRCDGPPLTWSLPYPVSSKVEARSLLKWPLGMTKLGPNYLTTPKDKLFINLDFLLNGLNFYVNDFFNNDRHYIWIKTIG